MYFEDNFPGWSAGVNFKKLVTFTAGLNISTGQTIQLNGLPIPTNEYITSNAIAAAGFAAAVPIYTFPNDSTTWKVTSASVRFTTAGGSSAAAQVELSASGTAPGSGTNQLTAGMALTGTANTVVNGTVIASPTTASAGYSLNLVPSGTMTGLVGMVVTVAMQRVS